MSCLAVVLGMVTMLIAGCGAGAADRPFDDALIREVGAGSEAANRLLPTLEAQAKLPPGDFRDDPRTDRVITLLLEGKVSSLTQADLDRTAKTIREGERRFDNILPEFERIAGEISAARVNVEAHRRLSANEKRFVDAWNGYLIVNAEEARSLGDTFGEMRPFFSGFQTLVGAASNTARPRSSAELENATTRLIPDLVARTTRHRAAVRRFAERLADPGLVELVNGDPEARVFVERVNQRYPDGVLAELFTTG